MEPDNTTAATKVTIKGKGIRLSEALQQLQKQSGNAITDLREQLGVDVTNPALDLDIKEKSFFEALDEIAGLAEVTTDLRDRRRDDRHHGAARSMDAAPGKPAPASPSRWCSTPARSGSSSSSWHQPGLYDRFRRAANVQLEVAWEPRLRPMLMKLDYENLKILDDHKPGGCTPGH